MIKIPPEEIKNLYGLPLNEIKTLRYLDRHFEWKFDDDYNVCIYSFLGNTTLNKKSRLNLLALKILYKDFGLRDGDCFVFEHSKYANLIHDNCYFYNAETLAVFFIALKGFTKKYLPINTCKIDGKIVPIFHILIKNMELENTYYLEKTDEIHIHKYLTRYALALERKKKGKKNPMICQGCRKTTLYYNPITKDVKGTTKKEGYYKCRFLLVPERTFCLKACLEDHKIYDMFIEDIGELPQSTETPELVKTMWGNSFNGDELFENFLSNYEKSDGWIVPFVDMQNADINHFYAQTGTSITDYKKENKDFIYVNGRTGKQKKRT